MDSQIGYAQRMSLAVTLPISRREVCGQAKVSTNTYSNRHALLEGVKSGGGLATNPF